MSTAHIVAHAAPAWGHMKPLLVFFARLAELRPASSMVFTLLTGEPILQKVLDEIKRMPASIAERINVVDIGEPKELLEPQLGFIPIFKALWKCDDVTLYASSTRIALPKPSVVILDAMCGFAVPVIKEVSAGTCPIMAWFGAPISSCMNFMGPEHLGGYGDLRAKIEAAAEESGKTPAEVADSVMKNLQGKVIQIPGLPPMYDYDFFPQEDNFPIPMGIIAQDWHRTMISCNGVLCVTFSAFEAETIVVSRAWLSSIGMDTYIVGPLEDVPPAAEVIKREVSTTPGDAAVINFLDNMLASHGRQSVIYLAFGTVWCPKDQTKLCAVIEEIITSGTPLLWGHASPFAVIPPELADKLANTPHAYHANWMPQLDVLRHSAVGWYITHGGWNSTQEALSLRVPTVIWPFGGDQPTNAALLSLKHRAAFELISVKTGPGAQQPYHLTGRDPVDFSLDGVRREVQELLVKLRSEEGKEIRRNADALGAAMEKSWKEGGEAIAQTNAFLAKYVESS